MSAKMVGIIESQAINRQENQIIFEQLNIPYWRSDSTGKTVYASPMLLAMVGLPLNRVMDFNWIDNVVVEKDRDMVRNLVNRTVHNQSQWYCEFGSLVYHCNPSGVCQVVDTVEVISKGYKALVNGRVNNWVGFILPKNPLLFQ